MAASGGGGLVRGQRRAGGGGGRWRVADLADLFVHPAREKAAAPRAAATDHLSGVERLRALAAVVVTWMEEGWERDVSAALSSEWP